MTLKMKLYALFEDQLNMHRTASNERTLISEILNLINEESTGKLPASISSDKFCVKLAFFSFFLWVSVAIMLL